MKLKEIIDDIAFYTDGQVMDNGLLQIQNKRVIVLLENENWNSTEWCEDLVEEIYLSRVCVLFVFQKKALIANDIIKAKIIQYFKSSEPVAILLDDGNYRNFTFSQHGDGRLKVIDIQPLNKFNLFEVK